MLVPFLIRKWFRYQSSRRNNLFRTVHFDSYVCQESNSWNGNSVSLTRTKSYFSNHRDTVRVKSLEYYSIMCARARARQRLAAWRTPLCYFQELKSLGARLPWRTQPVRVLARIRIKMSACSPFAGIGRTVQLCYLHHLLPARWTIAHLFRTNALLEGNA